MGRGGLIRSLLAVFLVLSSALVQSQVTAVETRRGGTVVAHHSGGRPARSGQAPRIETFYTGWSAWEPTLGLTKRGEIFYVAEQEQPNPTADDFPTSGVIRSSDRGRTWKDVSPRILNQGAHQLSNDPYLHVDRDTGRVFALNLPQYFSCPTLSFSDDLGKSWVTQPLACAGALHDHPMLFTGVPVTSPMVGYDKIVYYCWNELTHTACSKSLNGGLTFVRTAPLPFPSGLDCEGLSGHGVADRDGTIYIPKVCTSLRNENGGQPWLVISSDEGATWRAVRVARLAGPDHEAGVAVDRNGWLYFVWVAGKFREPYLSISKNSGRTWSRPRMIAPRSVIAAALPGIDAGAPGRIAVVYMGQAKDSRGWSGYVSVSADAASKNPTFYTGTVNDPRDPLDSTCTVHRCHSTGDFFDVVIGPDGAAWAAFVDGCRGSCVGAPRPQKPGEGIVSRMVGGARLN